MKSSLTLGVIANEFFAPGLGRMGGFGWAARQVTRCFTTDPTLRVKVVLLHGGWRATAEQGAIPLHGTRLLLPQRRPLDYMRRVRREAIDLLLSIDYRPNYQLLYWSLPRTPLIVWARAPWAPADAARVRSLRLPQAPEQRPQGSTAFDCTSLRWVMRAAPWLQRRVALAVPAPHLAAAAAAAYGVYVPHWTWLPNIIDLPPQLAPKSPHPRVVFLGRLDPLKRPWLCVELARQFPEVEFLMLGELFMHGAGSWQPTALPPNVRLLGHVDGAEKTALLASAWVLLNTSIHEGLPISCLEALACATPLLSCLDPGALVSRFGRYVGRWDGAGLEALPALGEHLRSLLDTPALRTRLGEEGRQWVAETHNRSRFLAAFETLRAQVGLPC